MTKTWIFLSQTEIFFGAKERGIQNVKKSYLGISVVPSNAEPQMTYKIKRVKRLPARRRTIITNIPAGNSIPMKFIEIKTSFIVYILYACHQRLQALFKNYVLETQIVT